MKPFAVATLLLAPWVAAQSRSDIPDCAWPCLDASIKKNTSCATDDFACICKNFDTIRGDSTNTGCILKSCGQDVALNKVLPATQKLCEQGGSGGGTVSSSPSSTAESGSASPSPTTAAQSSTTAKATAGAAGLERVSGPMLLALGALIV